jgi:predicted AAA+ superfamily ATPase
MNIQRDYLDRLENLKKIFPIIAVIWARQVWKTTFLKEQFKDYEYYNLESPATLDLVKKDPEGFLLQRKFLVTKSSS